VGIVVEYETRSIES